MKLSPRQRFKIYPAFAGQTLIETLVAILMLTMGVSAAVGLAVFALNSSANISKQIIATGLAREGLEAVKQMRDTNWLQQATINQNCWNYASGDFSAPCYGDWLGDKNLMTEPFCLNPTASAKCHGEDLSDSFNLGFDASTNNFWLLDQDNSNFGLKFNTPLGNAGFYSPTNTSCINAASTADYCRKITITKDYSPPYNHTASPAASEPGPLLKVQSFVWWVDKKCPRVVDWPQASPTCRLELDMYLTNWKNY